MRRLETTLTVVLVIAAVATAAAVTRQAFFGNLAGARTGTVLESTPLKNDPSWGDLLAISKPVGVAPGGALQIIVVSDFECPACRGFHEVMRSVESDLPGAFDWRIIHYPLSYHKFALPAARLFECGRGAHDYRSLADALFGAQDSLGLIPWSEVGARAGVHAARPESGCQPEKPSAVDERVRNGVAISRRAGVNATPTVFVEGARLSRPPDAEELKRIAEGQRM
jgi:protein-disulfide isomerase